MLYEMTSDSHEPIFRQVKAGSPFMNEKLNLKGGVFIILERQLRTRVIRRP